MREVRRQRESLRNTAGQIAGEVLAGQVAVDRADREGRRDRDVGDLEGRQRSGAPSPYRPRPRTRAHPCTGAGRAARVLALQDS